MLRAVAGLRVRSLARWPSWHAFATSPADEQTDTQSPKSLSLAPVSRLPKWLGPESCIAPDGFSNRCAQCLLLIWSSRAHYWPDGTDGRRDCVFKQVVCDGASVRNSHVHRDRLGMECSVEHHCARTRIRLLSSNGLVPHRRDDAYAYLIYYVW